MLVRIGSPSAWWLVSAPAFDCLCPASVKVHNSSQAYRNRDEQFPYTDSLPCSRCITASAYMVLLVYISSHSSHMYLTTSLTYSRLWQPSVLHLILSVRWFLFVGTIPSRSGVHFNTLVIFFSKERVSLLEFLRIEGYPFRYRGRRYITEISFVAT